MQGTNVSARYMQPIQQSISVGFRYPVHFAADAFAPANRLLKQILTGSGWEGIERLLFVIDYGVTNHHPRLLDSIAAYCRANGLGDAMAGQPVVIPGGEAVKNDPAHLQSLYQAINDRGICRHSFIVAIGGGAVLDVVGYAAATAHRGIRVIRMPTTVLGQNDSGVGVKTGVNAFGKKNFIGAFAPPFAVINDWNFLATLHDRDWRGGISEAVKVGLIKDRAFFEWIQQNTDALVKRDLPAMQKLIFRCAELHCLHIARSGDPFESGSARPLDFGHWAAHKLEEMTNYELRHGEAVAIGIALDVAYSALIGSITDSEVRTIHQCLANLKLPLRHSAMSDTATLMKGLEEFREHLGGQLTITLLRSIGEGYEVHEIDHGKMRRAIATLAANR